MHGAGFVLHALAAVYNSTHLAAAPREAEGTAAQPWGCRGADCGSCPLPATTELLLAKAHLVRLDNERTPQLSLVLHNAHTAGLKVF